MIVIRFILLHEVVDVDLCGTASRNIAEESSTFLRLVVWLFDALSFLGLRYCSD